jgi:hypothetical protein
MIDAKLMVAEAMNQQAFSFPSMLEVRRHRAYIAASAQRLVVDPSDWQPGGQRGRS